MNLTALILEIVCETPGGLTHAQLVRKVLEKGYRTMNLSEKVHIIVKNLTQSNMIYKNPETRIIENQQQYA